MRLNRLDLNLLVTLDALLIEKNITRAAERIHLSQPAASGALARLREFFDDEILVRVGSQMQPTPLGESLAEPVRNILMQIQTTVERGLEFKPEESERKFRILASDYTTTTLMTHVARKIEAIAPRVQLEFFAPTSNPVKDLEEGEIDFLLLPDHVISKSSPSDTVFQDEFVCVGWEENPHLENGISLESYRNLGHVSSRFGSTRRISQDLIYLKNLHNIEPRVEIVTSTFTAIPEFLSGSHRITTTYRHLAKLWAKSQPLKIVPLPVELPVMEWCLQWHQYRDLDPAVQWLRRQIKETAAEIQGQFLLSE